MTEIEKLSAEVARCREALDEATDALDAALIAASGFEEGEVVEARKQYGRNETWRPAVIRRIIPRYYGDMSRCRYIISFANKGGDWSKVTVDYAEVRKAS